MVDKSIRVGDTFGPKLIWDCGVSLTRFFAVTKDSSVTGWTSGDGVVEVCFGYYGDPIKHYQSRWDSDKVVDVKTVSLVSKEILSQIPRAQPMSNEEIENMVYRYEITRGEY